MASINPPQQTQQQQQQQQEQETQFSKLYTTYIGLSFAVFLSLFPTLHSQNRRLLRRLRSSSDELSELRSRRQEDSKANARVVEIFATHRNSWAAEERRLLRRLDDSSEEISRLRSRLSDVETEAENLRRDVAERDELLSFMSRHNTTTSTTTTTTNNNNNNVEFGDVDDNFIGDFNSRFWGDPSNLWQDVQYEPVEPTQHAKHYVVRRESPWKVDGESTGVTSKLKLLEDELLNLEKVGKNSSVKVTSLMRKQAKRYQDIAGKIDDLCKRMQASDPSEPALSSEFRSQRQTEFLLEAFQLQQRASETGKKLLTLQTEIYSHSHGDNPETRHAMRRCLDTIRSNFKDIQRNMEIWLARIMGDLEGILARDGATRSRDYYFPKYPYANNSFN